MSKINGEKARAAIQKRRRTAQRLSDRTRRAEVKPVTEPQPEPKASKK